MCGIIGVYVVYNGIWRHRQDVLDKRIFWRVVIPFEKKQLQSQLFNYLHFILFYCVKIKLFGFISFQNKYHTSSVAWEKNCLLVGKVNPIAISFVIYVYKKILKNDSYAIIHTFNPISHGIKVFKTFDFLILFFCDCVCVCFLCWYIAILYGLVITISYNNLKSDNWIRCWFLSPCH